MVIRASSSRDIEQLMVDLREGGSAREAAVARLRVIGGRADGRLASFIASDAASSGRQAALRALEGREEARARQIARAACDDTDSDVAIAAIAVLRGWVSHESGTEVLDVLSGIALDPRREGVVRLAALDALSEFPADIVRPLLQRMPASLKSDGSVGEALDNPLAMSEWIAGHRDAPLSALHEAIVRSRSQDQDGLPTHIRQAWTVARGAAHAALAERGSRVALYDLRESFDAARTPLPLDFLSAMSALGDVTCMEALARAWSAAPEDTWWRDRLRETAADILKRDKLTGRHPAIKRLRSRYPDFV